MEVEQKNQEREFNWERFPNTRWHYLIFSLFILFALGSPILFTQLKSCVSFTNDTGVIGDTIGGIMSPWINLLAAFLVFVAFKAQIHANRDQRERLDKQEIEFKKEQERAQKRENFNTLLLLIKDVQNDYREINQNSEFERFSSEFVKLVDFSISSPHDKDCPIKLRNLLNNKAIFIEFYSVFRRLDLFTQGTYFGELKFEDKALILDITKIFYSLQLSDKIEKILRVYKKAKQTNIISSLAGKENFFNTLESLRHHLSNYGFASLDEEASI